ncbi:VOC family protein [bacterium]|nr:VOC family protein [bacterium]
MAFQSGHIGLNVTDLDRSKKFYRDVFGFEILRESREDGRRFAFLGIGSRTVLTLWQQSQSPERFEKEKPGLHHLSFQVDSIEEVKVIERKLREMQVLFLYDGIVAHLEGSKSGGVFFHDPDGIRLEIFSPTGADSHPAARPDAPSCGFF